MFFLSPAPLPRGGSWPSVSPALLDDPYESVCDKGGRPRDFECCHRSWQSSPAAFQPAHPYCLSHGSATLDRRRFCQVVPMKPPPSLSPANSVGMTMTAAGKDGNAVELRATLGRPKTQPTNGVGWRRWDTVPHGLVHSLGSGIACKQDR